MTGSDNNNGDNNNSNTPTPENTPVNTPAPENNPTPENTPATPADKPAENTASTETPSTEAAVPPAEPAKLADIPETKPEANNVVSFVSSGGCKVSGSVPKGTTLEKAIKLLGGSATGLSFRDSKNNSLTLSSLINDNIEVTATARASGG